MALDRFDRIVGASLAGLALLIAGLFALDAAIGVRVIGLDPPDGEPLGSRSGLEVTFAEAMDSLGSE